ncbi:hypothetical protein QTP88_011384 [Uroleucon formosanum]
MHEDSISASQNLQHYLNLLSDCDFAKPVFVKKMYIFLEFFSPSACCMLMGIREFVWSLLIDCGNEFFPGYVFLSFGVES